jgi:hypothetical protein
VAAGAATAATIVIDLDQVSFLDAAGLGLIARYAMADAHRDPHRGAAFQRDGFTRGAMSGKRAAQAERRSRAGRLTRPWWA